MKTVCFVTGYLGGTHGTAKSARDFLRALLACYSNVRVIGPTKEKYPETVCGFHLSIPEWIVLPVKNKIIKNSMKSWTNYGAYLFRKKQCQRELIKSVETKIVFVNGWASYSYWKEIENRFCCPKAMVVRESPRHFAGRDRYMDIMKQVHVLSEFDLLIFVAERVCHEWMEFPELNSKKAFVLPNCCEEEEVAFQLKKDLISERMRLNFKQDDFLIICPGTIEHRKGQDLLLKIVPELSKRIKNLKVLFVGDIGTEWGNCFINKINKNPLLCCVTHLNAKPQILDLLHISDLLVFPSRAEALPRTVLESMAIKLPVVCSAVDGIPEIVEDRRTGLLFNSEDCSKLLEYILELYSKKEYRIQLAQAGYERYWEKYSRKNQIERMLSHLLYNSNCFLYSLTY